MSYQALYRKWRPLTFDDVRGQDAIVTTLKNQIRTGRIGHAYLFCGTRGTGKTSIAKIFARAVNCPNTEAHDGNPCNECPVCQSILSGSSMNVFEIDAASNNGVDNIRDIREQVEYPPTEGRFKVYIIDEVHMLSTGAFNALLKTLEEPPAYVIFILATTDPQKIPQTILSRCQRYDFRRIGTDTIAGRIHELMQAEQLDIEERAVRYVARAADGSMRDALSLLDQCLAFHYGQKLTYENVLDVLGAVDTSVFSELYRAICGKDVEGALRIVNDLVNAGREIGQFVNDFIWYMRNILLVGSTGGEDIVDVAKENEDRLREDAQTADKGTLLRLMSAMSELSNRMRFAAQKRILLEVELIRLCTSGMYGGAVYGTSAARPADMRAGTALRGNSGSAGGYAAVGQTGDKVASDNMAAAASEFTAAPASAAELPDSKCAAGTAREANAPDAAQPAVSASAAESETAAPPVPEQDRTETAGTEAEALPEFRLEPKLPDQSLAQAVRENWESLCRELSPANRAVFMGTALRQEQPDGVTVVFKNAINYKIAAMNRDENGLKRLSELVSERLGLNIVFRARQAKPGEFDESAGRVTDEDLLKIHFPVDIE